MSTRRSARAKAPVKYTSDSDGSDYGAKKPRAKLSKAASATTPSSKKRTTKDAPTTSTPTPSKRPKKDVQEPAPAHSKNAAKATKQHLKSTWTSWLAAHALPDSQRQLPTEPPRDASITQTDALHKYALKKEDLAVLQYFAKANPNPLFKHDVKLFVEEEVRALGFRRLGMLEGGKGDVDVDGDGEEVVRRGEGIWREMYKGDVDTDASDKKEEKPPQTRLYTDDSVAGDY